MTPAGNALGGACGQGARARWRQSTRRAHAGTNGHNPPRMDKKRDRRRRGARHPPDGANGECARPMTPMGQGITSLGNTRARVHQWARGMARARWRRSASNARADKECARSMAPMGKARPRRRQRTRCATATSGRARDRGRQWARHALGGANVHRARPTAPMGNARARRRQWARYAIDEANGHGARSLAPTGNNTRSLDPMGKARAMAHMGRARARALAQAGKSRAHWRKWGRRAPDGAYGQVAR